MLDPIAEMLTKIRNAQRAGHQDVLVRFSKVKLAIAKILEQEGFVGAIGEEMVDNKKNIKIDLKYYKVSNTEKNPAISEIQRISREGKRVYIKNKDIKSVRNNFGVAIVSTSKGVMTGAQSRKLGLGGEYICQVW